MKSFHITQQILLIITSKGAYLVSSSQNRRNLYLAPLLYLIQVYSPTFQLFDNVDFSYYLLQKMLSRKHVLFWAMAIATWRQSQMAHDVRKGQDNNEVNDEMTTTLPNIVSNNINQKDSIVPSTSGSPQNLIPTDDNTQVSFHAGEQNFEDLLYLGYQHFQCNRCADGDRTPEWNFPKLFILGAQKGGTSALREYLGGHPDVFKFKEEVHFFEKTVQPDSKNVAFGSNYTDKCPALEQYRNHLLRLVGKKYYPTDAEQIVVDKTPEYLVNSHELPQRMLCLFPEAKFVVVLRNPVGRSYSHYNHKTRKGGVQPDFADMVEKEHRSLVVQGLLNETLTPAEEYAIWSRYRSKQGVISRGLYAFQLRQWISVLYDHFGAEKMWDHLLILESERAQENKQEYFNKVLHFAGMKNHKLENRQSLHV
jgi:hypothetical protein